MESENWPVDPIAAASRIVELIDEIDARTEEEPHDAGNVPVGVVGLSPGSRPVRRGVR
jgi:hypothetical protein